MKIGRQVFTTAVVGTTIAWSIGFASLVQPLAARAASAGDLVKGSLPAVYYVGADGKRYVFPNAKTYGTWYADFSGVQTLSDSAISAMAIGGNVVYRGGTRLVKIQTDPRVYAVETQGKIRWVESEAVASALYGANWASRVDDVADVFFVDYTPGTSLADASKYPTGSLVKNPGDPDVYYVDGSSKRWLTGTAMTANRFMNANVLETSQNLSVYTDGANVTGAEAGLTDTSQTGGAPTPGAGLSVTLASDTPASATVPNAASGVPFLAVNLSSAGNVTVTGITFKRFGVGDRADLGDVFLYGPNGRLTDGRTINADNEVAYSGLNLAVSSTPTKLWLKVDITDLGGVSGGTHGFQVASASKVASNAGSVTGSFPVSGNTMSIGAATAGTLTIDATGTISNPTIGQDNVELARFTLMADEEDASVRSLNLTVDGTIDNEDLSNLTLWQGSTKLATVAAVTANDLIVFNLTQPYALADGATRTFSMKGDVTGDAGDTIEISLEEPSDLSAIGSDFGFGMTVDNAGYDGCADCSDSALEGGQLTVAFNGPTTSDLSIDSTDQTFMKFSMTAEQFITVKGFSILVDCTAGADCDDDIDDGGGLINDADDDNDPDTANYGDWRIVNATTGSTLMGPEELDVDGSDDVQELDFTEDFTMNAGQTLDLLVTADIEDNVDLADNGITVTLEMGTLDVEDANGDALDEIIPTADIDGNEMTMTAASMDIALTTPPSDNADETHIKGTNGVSSVAFSFTAGEAEDVTVTSVTLTTCVDGDAAGPGDLGDFACDGVDEEGTDLSAQDRVGSVSLYDGTTLALLDGPSGVEADGTVIFDSIDWTVPAGDTKKLLVKANISTFDVTDGDADAYAFDIVAAGDVTVQDEDGNEFDVGGAFANLNGTGVAPTVFIRVADAGTLDVTTDPGSPDPDIVLGGSTDVTMSKFKFHATDEAFTVQELTIAETSAVDNGLAAGSYDNDISSVKLSYKDQAGATQTKTGFLTGGAVKFSGLTMNVPANGNAVLTVMATLPTVDDSAETGEKPRLDFDGDVADGFKAVGTSGETLDEDDVDDATAEVMVIRETKPTISLVTTGWTPSTSLSMSERFRFTVAASAGEDVVLKSLTFRLNTTDNDASGWNTCEVTVGTAGLDAGDFNLKDSSNTVLEDADANWALLEADGSPCEDEADVVAFARLTFGAGDEEVVAAGTTSTYKLEMNVTGASTLEDDSLSIDMLEDPIVAAFLAVGADLDEEIAAGETDDIAVGGLGAIVAGDLVCFDEGDGGTCGATEEIALVLDITGGDLTVYRGDLGRVEGGASADGIVADGADLLRLPASVVWDDDGDSTTINEISSYLLDNLDINGPSVVF